MQGRELNHVRNKLKQPAAAATAAPRPHQGVSTQPKRKERRGRPGGASAGRLGARPRMPMCAAIAVPINASHVHWGLAARGKARRNRPAVTPGNRLEGWGLLGGGAAQGKSHINGAVFKRARHGIGLRLRIQPLPLQSPHTCVVLGSRAEGRVVQQEVQRAAVRAPGMRSGRLQACGWTSS